MLDPRTDVIRFHALSVGRLSPPLLQERRGTPLWGPLRTGHALARRLGRTAARSHIHALPGWPWPRHLQDAIPPDRALERSRSDGDDAREQSLTLLLPAMDPALVGDPSAARSAETPGGGARAARSGPSAWAKWSSPPLLVGTVTPRATACSQDASCSHRTFPPVVYAWCTTEGTRLDRGHRQSTTAALRLVATRRRCGRSGEWAGSSCSPPRTNYASPLAGTRDACSRASARYRARLASRRRLTEATSATAGPVPSPRAPRGTDPSGNASEPRWSRGLSNSDISRQSVIGPAPCRVALERILTQTRVFTIPHQITPMGPRPGRP